jgi:YesN/AraC family two-component response regulator
MYLSFDYSSINSYFFIFTQLLLLVFVSQIFKYPLISLGIPISNRIYKPKENAIDQSSRTYLFDSNEIDQKILDWEDMSGSYLKKDFNLSQFSKELQIDELELLYYFSEYKEINFEDYLKFLRISFVLKKIKSKYLDNHSLSDLALISGFKDGKSLEKEFEKVLKSKINDFIEP